MGSTPIASTKKIMLYIYFFSFAFFSISCSFDEFKRKTEEFKYRCQTKQVDKMHKTADSLLLFMQQYVKDSDVKSINPVVIEGLYTFVKLLGTKRDVPLYKDWLLNIRPGTQNLLQARQNIFEKIYPPLKVLHDLVKVRTLSMGEEVTSDEKKIELNHENLIDQASLNMARIHRYLLFKKDSKLSGVWFDQQQAQLLALLASVLQQSQPVTSRAWCSAAAVLAQHLFVVESTNSVKKSSPSYYTFKSLYDVHVLPHFKDKNVMIPSSLLIPQLLQASQFNKHTYLCSDNLAFLIERVNEKLFKIHKTALENGPEAIDEKMKSFVFQVALLNHYLVTFQPINPHGFKHIAFFQKTRKDLNSNLDEIFKLLKIS